MHGPSSSNVPRTAVDTALTLSPDTTLISLAALYCGKARRRPTPPGSWDRANAIGVHYNPVQLSHNSPRGPEHQSPAVHEM